MIPRMQQRDDCVVELSKRKRGTSTYVLSPSESSNLRHIELKNDYPTTPVATQLQQKEVGFNQVAVNQHVSINMQAGQPEQSSSQPQSSLDLDEPNIDSTVVQKKRHVRRPTHCIKLSSSVDRMKVVSNELGQPVGPEAAKLTSFLGLIARDGNLAPLIYLTWNKMPEENKESVWLKVLAKFDIDPGCRSWVLMSLRSKWRSFKSHLKSTHYDTHATDAERPLDCDERVLPDQWSFLVSQWSSEKFQSLSAKNKANRAKVRFNHTAGSKSYARIREEEEPTRAELFILSRTHKNGQPVNEATAAVISQVRESTIEKGETLINNKKFQDEAYTRVMGPDRKGGVSLYGKAFARADALRMAKEKNAEVVKMKERLASVEQTCSQMSAMMSMMTTMHKGSSSANFPNAGAGASVPVGMSPNQAEPTSTSNHDIPAKQTRGRKKRR